MLQIDFILSKINIALIDFLLGQCFLNDGLQYFSFHRLLQHGLYPIFGVSVIYLFIVHGCDCVYQSLKVLVLGIFRHDSERSIRDYASLSQ